MSVALRTVTVVAGASAVVLVSAVLTAHDGADTRSFSLVAFAWAALTAVAFATSRLAAYAESRTETLAAELDTERARRASAELELAGLESAVRTINERTLPNAVHQLRAGESLNSVLATVSWPHNHQARSAAETFLREIGTSERRFVAAQTASATALGRVQARTIKMLADLRGMQDRHDDVVWGDLLTLDHNASQIGLLTDRLALLMGGRSSRSWNRPIVLESILRGAVGRIAAYQRVHLRTSSTARVSGYAAEALMHLLAELMDNAANFSPPTERVTVRAEEDPDGLVISIEDNGLRMSGAALSYAKAAVAGGQDDLASLRGTRLGLAVVGRLAAKYEIRVSFQTSNAGGTRAFVQVPRHLLSSVSVSEQAKSIQQRRSPTDDAGLSNAPASSPSSANSLPARRPASAGTTPNGLPRRTRGSSAVRQDRRTAGETSALTPPGSGPPSQSAGALFGGFHRNTRVGRDALDRPDEPTPSPPE